MRFSIIEEAANTILLKAKIFKPAVKADFIAEFSYDLNWAWCDLDKYCSTGEVLAAINFAEQKIYLNESRETEFKNSPGRRNFTIAHELGHWILHKHLAQEGLPGFDQKLLLCRGINNTSTNPERQANFFASCLLMPRAFIEEALKDFKSPMDEYDIKQISKKFCVSKQAMTIRLVDELHFLYDAGGLYYRSEDDFLAAGGQLTLF